MSNAIPWAVGSAITKTALLLTTGLLIPTAMAHRGWDDFSGLYYAGFVRIFLSLHLTFLVNSLAHWQGNQPYTGSLPAATSL
jgi:stearoyl-CoA desaturase (delta-9 desaturase)